MGLSEWHIFEKTTHSAYRAMGPTTTTGISRVQAVLVLLEARLHTMSSFSPGHPIHKQEEEKLREGFVGLWEQLSGLPLSVTVKGLQWEADTVLPIADENEGFVRALSEAGIRFVAFFPGVEAAEITTFLAAIHRSRSLTDEDVDDLLTLLWTADFQYIRYKAPEVVQEGEAAAEEERPPAPSNAPKAEEVRRQVVEEVGDVGTEPPTPTVVDLEAYESTLYFLGGSEIEYLKREVEHEYDQDLGGNVIALLLDTFELQTDTEVRSEIIAVLTDMLPQLLIGGGFGSVSYLISEARVVLKRTPQLDSAHRKQLNQLAAALSAPSAVAQLIQALDEARVDPSEEDLQALLAELSPEALTITLKWLPRLSNERARKLLNHVMGHLVEARSGVIETALVSDDLVVILEALRLVEERRLTGLASHLVNLAEHDDVRVRAALVPALLRTPTAQTLAALVPLLRDPDPDVRIGAVQGLSAHAYVGALGAVEEVIRDPKATSDLTERRAFFEAYGSIAGEAAVPTLKTLVLGGSFGMGRGDSDTRACATVALGQVGTRSARLILQKAAEDRDVVVRTAAARALRQEGT